MLSPQEFKDINIIGEWPYEMSYKFILAIPNSNHPDQILSHEYVLYFFGVVTIFF